MRDTSATGPIGRLARFSCGIGNRDLGPGVAVAAPAHAAGAHGHVIDQRHACTHTSSGSCIRGGEFCPQASCGNNGWDAKGRRYVCKGSRVHPHWMLP